MKKRSCIWFFNHYACSPETGPLTRHYTFCKYLRGSNISTAIFAANELHYVRKRIDTNRVKYIEKKYDGISFIYIPTTHYTRNNIKRLLNLITYYVRIFNVTKDYMQSHEKPDVIYASTMQPLALSAGIKIAKRYNAKCICEVRDLFPDGLVAHNIIKKGGLIDTVLSKWISHIYSKADAIVFTMEGCHQYIKDKKWDINNGGEIDLNKVHYINNGVDLELFNNNLNLYKLNDDDLDDKRLFKVIYTGSINETSNMSIIIDAAKLLKKRGVKNTKLLIWGEGSDKEKCVSIVKQEGLEGVIEFKGYVDKCYIPYIVSHSNINLVSGTDKGRYKYGISMNKFFDYFAAGKPVISMFKSGFSFLEASNAGIELNEFSAAKLCEYIIKFKNMKRDDYNRYCENAHLMAKEFDYKHLTERLIHEVISKL